MKYASDIIKYGKIKPFFDKTYSFNTIDIETIDNKLFMFGYTKKGQHYIAYNDFYNNVHNFLIHCLQHNKDILTWSRYDNTHLLKLLLSKASKYDINKILLRVGKVTPIYTYVYKGFTFAIENIIKDNIIFKITDFNERSKRLIIYNLKNLYDTDLLTTALNYDLNYYSKIGIEYHIINKKRFKSDLDYKSKVIESNRLDNIVLLDIAKKMLDNFKLISGNLPKSIFTNGSLARSYELTQIDKIGSKNINYINLFGKNKMSKKLLDYSMRSYHGGKIESYILGYLKKAKVIDITSAYPYAMSLLPKLTAKVIKSDNLDLLETYFYAFIKCEIHVKDSELIHPSIVENPCNKSNI